MIDYHREDEGALPSDLRSHDVLLASEHMPGPELDQRLGADLGISTCPIDSETIKQRSVGHHSDDSLISRRLNLTGETRYTAAERKQFNQNLEYGRSVVEWSGWNTILNRTGINYIKRLIIRQ